MSAHFKVCNNSSGHKHVFRLSSIAFCIVHVHGFACVLVTTLFYFYHSTNAKLSTIVKPAAKHLPFVMIYLIVNF